MLFFCNAPIRRTNECVLIQCEVCYVMSFFPAVNEDEEENTTSCKYPWRDLFVWALLFNRRELADMFWHRTENSTGIETKHLTTVRAPYAVT